MTLKQWIDLYFEEHVIYDDEKMLFYEQDFWDAWDKLCLDIDLNGVQWACEWHEDAPEITPQRKEYIVNAIEKYVMRNLKPGYTNC